MEQTGTKPTEYWVLDEERNAIDGFMSNTLDEAIETQAQLGLSDLDLFVKVQVN